MYLSPPAREYIVIAAWEVCYVVCVCTCLNVCFPIWKNHVAVMDSAFEGTDLYFNCVNFYFFCSCVQNNKTSRSYCTNLSWWIINWHQKSFHREFVYLFVLIVLICEWSCFVSILCFIKMLMIHFEWIEDKCIRFMMHYNTN